ncbi:site-specific integrase, partial [Saccharothrix algeriensis]
MGGKSRENGEGSIYPYKNGYAAYAWVVTPEGKRTRKYVYGKTRDDVHAKWVKLMGVAANGPVATKTPKLGPFLLRWLADVVKPNSAPLTYATNETFIRLHILPHLGEVTFPKLTVVKAQQWMNKIAVTCQCCAQGK